MHPPQIPVTPSLGLFRRRLVQDITVPNASSRSLHVSARRLEDQPSNPPPSAPAPQQQRDTRRARSAEVSEKLRGIAYRRPLPASTPQAGGASPSGQHLEGAPNGVVMAKGPSAIRRVPQRPGVQGEQGATHRLLPQRPAGDAPVRSPMAPAGTMVRAPSQLNISRSAGGPQSGGPNLRGRGSVAGASRAVRGSKEARPKQRERKAAGAGAAGMFVDVKTEDTLSDGMVQQLLRLQNKEWERKPYEPRYGLGSPAVAELLEEGKKLFEGEVKKEKAWGRLEKRIGIVGMHGA
ncbi:hypothetical protein BDV95DRAFT_487073 [Massariosphaeria phaeospora]|uniref:Uncharacterized protein n=1 Tax=Massariosphaeria phaeospora TaxID=100035 RepID=A0A7C8MEK7_9PLEO|nr:hypothetical protein BDV95DRAFT_487073 [Massariosphaeria phaeospora]